MLLPGGQYFCGLEPTQVAFSAIATCEILWFSKATGSAPSSLSSRATPCVAVPSTDPPLTVMAPLAETVLNHQPLCPPEMEQFSKQH